MEGIACMLSRFWKRKLNLTGPGYYRTATDLDFFRGEVGSIDRPDMLDDANSKDITPAKWKAFCDVGLTEAMSRERWGASKWVRNQLRLWAFNPMDETAEPPNTHEQVSHVKFMELIEPLWKTDSKVGMDLESKIAVLKRLCVVALTTDWVLLATGV